MRPTVPGEHLGFWSGEFRDTTQERRFRARKNGGRDWAMVVASIWLFADALPHIYIYTSEVGWGLAAYIFVFLRIIIAGMAIHLGLAAWRQTDYRVIDRRALTLLLTMELTGTIMLILSGQTTQPAAVAHMAVAAGGFFFAPFRFRLRLIVSGYFMIVLLIRFGIDGYNGAVGNGFLVYWTIAACALSMLASRMFRAHNRTVYLYRLAERDHIRRLRTARDDAAMANEVKTDFVAATAHDLRNPLNAVIGFSDIIEAQLFGPNRMDKYREAARDINTCARQMLQQIESLLDAAVLEARPQQLKLEPVRIAGVAETVARQARASSNKKDLTFDVLVDKDLPPVLADENALHQILANLVANAQKYTPDGGRVSIDTVVQPNEMAIRVLDTGSGIPEHQRTKAKDRFITGISDHPATDEQGWGLGLSIVDSLVKAHGGRLELEPNIPRGTIASIIIPKRPLQARPAIN